MREEQPRRVLAALEAFLKTPKEDLLRRHLAEDPAARALALFQRTAREVPAYGAFLAERGVDPATLRGAADFARVPPITKENYIRRYSLRDRCREGALDACDMVAVSSGSTGEPTFWPRFVTDELEIAARFEQVFGDSFDAGARRTLAVVCFSLGTWVGGMFTASCCRLLAAKGYPITLVTPGNVKEEIWRVVERLGPELDQVVLLGYPPFLKDVIDSGAARGVDWARHRVKLVLAGEVFSEEWRTLVGERTGGADPCRDSASLYGTADAGVLGNETPLSIAIRRALAARPEAARALFGEPRLPTLVQYDPMSRFIEAEGGRLLFSGDSGVPLVRYDILDTGGVIPFYRMLDFLAEWGIDPFFMDPLPPGRSEPPDASGSPDPLAASRSYRLPFVYVFGRSDFTISYFGANIYPENVTVGLEQPEVKGWVTGKFVLESREDADHDRFLAIAVELAPGAAGTEERRRTAAGAILASLLRLNSEFKSYVPPDRREPQVTLLAHGDPEYFPVGVKHRYTRR